MHKFRLSACHWPTLQTFLAALVMLIGTDFGIAESSQAHLMPKCGGKFDLCGYWNAETEKLEIDYHFEAARPFEEGLAAVSMNGKFGFINRKGRFVVAPRFDKVSDFYNGAASVKTGYLAGAIDKDGKYIIEPNYAEVMPLTDKVFVVQTLEVNSIHWKSAIRNWPDTNTWYSPHRLQGQLFNAQTGWMDDRTYDFRRAPARNVSFVRVRNPKSDSILGEYGILNFSGKWLSKHRFATWNHFPDRKLFNAKIDKATTTGRNLSHWVTIDYSGKLVITPEHNTISSWQRGYSIVKIGGYVDETTGKIFLSKYGLMGFDGKLVGDRYYDWVELSTKESAARVRRGGVWFDVDDRGQLSPSVKRFNSNDEDELILSCEEGLEIVRSNGLVKVFDHEGKFVTNINETIHHHLFGSLKIESAYSSGCKWPIRIQVGKSFNYVYSNGLLMFEVPKFEEAGSFLRARAWVKFNGKWGLIDTTGRFVVQPRYSSVRTVHSIDGVSLDNAQIKKQSVFAAELGKQTHYLNRKGEHLQKNKLIDSARGAYLKCNDGLKLFQQYGLWGFKSYRGHSDLPPRYRAISCFSRGIAWVAVDEKKLWCPMNSHLQLFDLTRCKKSHYDYAAGTGNTSRNRFSHRNIPEKLHNDPYENSVRFRLAQLEFGMGFREMPPTWTIRSKGNW